MKITNTLLAIALLLPSILIGQHTGYVPVVWLALLIATHRWRPSLWVLSAMCCFVDFSLSKSIGVTAIWLGITLFGLRYMRVLNIRNSVLTFLMSVSTVILYADIFMHLRFVEAGIALLVVWITMLLISKRTNIEEIG